MFSSTENIKADDNFDQLKFKFKISLPGNDRRPDPVPLQILEKVQQRHRRQRRPSSPTSLPSRGQREPRKPATVLRAARAGLHFERKTDQKSHSGLLQSSACSRPVGMECLQSRLERVAGSEVFTDFTNLLRLPLNLQTIQILLN
jgi:hypothetical protein